MASRQQPGLGWRHPPLPLSHTPQRSRRRTVSAPAFLFGTVAVALLLCTGSVYLVSRGQEERAVEPPREPLPASVETRAGLSRGDECQAAYDRVAASFTPGLSAESLRRSRAWIGNQQRFRNLARNLTAGKDVHVVTFGGSITLGHGVVKIPRNATGFESGPYHRFLESWLNDHYRGIHKSFNLAAHGADICALEKRINAVLTMLEKQKTHPDLILLEFAVNDYQGQDHIIQVDSKTDVFFRGFEDIALCGEAVVYKLLRAFPRAALAFLEFRTAISSRKTGELLHSGVARHYEVPVISYSEAMFPEYFRLVSMLNESDRYTVPEGETLLPFPYGCQPCNPSGIDPFFNHFRPPDKHCRTVCDLIVYGNGNCDMFQSPPSGRAYCHPAIFAVDPVHPSTVGHRIARDLIGHAIASAVRDECRREPLFPAILPSTGWLGSPEALVARTNFLDVRDADCFLPVCHKLQPTRTSAGFTYYSDVKAVNFDKFGWIATNPEGGEMIEFDIALPQRPCYAVYVAVLRSYEGMGIFTVEVENMETRVVKAVELDGLWNPKISVWSDNQITQDDDMGACTGKCKVRIKTHLEVKGREGNKVKILTISARECNKAISKLFK